MASEAIISSSAIPAFFMFKGTLTGLNECKNCYLCQDMGRLIDDIMLFLNGCGIECSRQMRHDFDVICAKLPDGKGYRTILPLEISATDTDEAARFSDDAYEAVRFIRTAEGYPLIITEDRWKSGRAMMEARLLAHIEVFNQIFARNCVVRRIEKAEAREFLAACHSYGYAACRYRYGLFNRRDGSLVAVATFSNARKWVKEGRGIRSYEWTRYASLPGVRICGGMGKLLKAFVDEVRPDDIMSYADLEWSEGRVYKTLGFKEELGKDAVCFTINPDTWERTAIRRHDGMAQEQHGYCFRNFGSAKYRLKLTDYQ